MSIRTALVAVVVALATALTLAPPAQAATAAEYSASAFRATNHHRVEHDRVRLRHSDCLQRFARKQAVRMADREQMFHQALGPIMNTCHLQMSGENVAYGFPSGRAVVNKGWMHSAGHRANILEPRYRSMAIVARQAPDGTWYVSQVFGRKA
jgi:uncharacterized protein YkwD